MRIRSLVAAALAVGALLGTAAPAAAATEVEAAGGIGTYYITFRTGDVSEADTEDSVRITVFGDQGQSPPVQIDRDFRRGETITFGPYKWPNIGNVGWISLGKSGRESDAWYSEYVQIHDESELKVSMCETNYLSPKRTEPKYWGCRPL